MLKLAGEKSTLFQNLWNTLMDAQLQPTSSENRKYFFFRSSYCFLLRAQFTLIEVAAFVKILVNFVISAVLFHTLNKVLFDNVRFTLNWYSKFNKSFHLKCCCCLDISEVQALQKSIAYVKVWAGFIFCVWYVIHYRCKCVWLLWNESRLLLQKSSTKV